VILRLKCTKFDFGWGSAPHPAGGAYSAPPDRLAGFKGTYFYGERGEGMGGGRREERGRGEGRDLLKGLRGIDAPVAIHRWSAKYIVKQSRSGKF